MFLDDSQFFIMNELCANGKFVYADNILFKELVEESGYNTESFAQSIIDTGLVYSDGVQLQLLTDKCVCGISPQGQCFAGDDRTGRVSRWLAKVM